MAIALFILKVSISIDDISGAGYSVLIFSGEMHISILSCVLGSLFTVPLGSCSSSCPSLAPPWLLEARLLFLEPHTRSTQDFQCGRGLHKLCGCWIQINSYIAGTSYQNGPILCMQLSFGKVKTLIESYSKYSFWNFRKGW